MNATVGEMMRFIKEVVREVMEETGIIPTVGPEKPLTNDDLRAQRILDGVTELSGDTWEYSLGGGVGSGPSPTVTSLLGWAGGVSHTLISVGPRGIEDSSALELACAAVRAIADGLFVVAPGVMDDPLPQIDAHEIEFGATVSEMIAALRAIESKYGGEIRVELWDSEPNVMHFSSYLGNDAADEEADSVVLYGCPL